MVLIVLPRCRIPFLDFFVEFRGCDWAFVEGVLVSSYVAILEIDPVFQLTTYGVTLLVSFLILLSGLPLESGTFLFAFTDTVVYHLRY